jgi:endonuclease III
MKNWASDLEPLIQKYGKRKHPLNYQNRYQLIVVVILSAQSTDNLINKISPAFFEAYPSIAELKKSNPEDLYPLLSSVRGFRKKSQWLTDISKIVADDSRIPTTMSELTKLPGIGRKSASVIIRESGDTAEGIIVDLHVVRVAPRLGVVTDNRPDKIEKQLMEAIPQKNWNEIGMALSFHGREICRPTPKCEECIVNQVCNYYNTVVKVKSKSTSESKSKSRSTATK